MQFVLKEYRDVLVHPPANAGFCQFWQCVPGETETFSVFFGLDGHGFSANNDQSMIRESLKNAKSRFKPTEISLEFTIKKLQNKPVCQAEWEQNFCAWCRHHGYVYLTHRQ